MKIAPKFHGEIKNGKLTLENPPSFIKYLSTLNGRVSIVVKKYRKQRTLPQNSYYWACIQVLADWCGHDKDEVHFWMRYKFLSQPDSNIDIPRSTTELSTVEFSEYFEKIAKFAAENGVVLPDPDNYETFYPYGDENI